MLVSRIMYSLVSHEVEQHQGGGAPSAPVRPHSDPSFDPVQCFKCKAVMTRSAELLEHTCR